MTLQKKIEQWAKDKGIDTPERADRQFLKLVEEFGEIHAAYIEEDSSKFRDAIGDCLVVSIILAKQKSVELDLNFNKPITKSLDYSSMVVDLGKIAEGLAKNTDIAEALQSFVDGIILDAEYEDHSPEECLQEVYDIISKRTGKTVNGVFIKDN